VALGFEPAGADGEALLILAEYASDAVPGRDDDTIEASITKAVLKGAGIAPHSVRLLAPGSLPRTSSGKMRRREALRRFLAGQLTPPARTGPDRLAVAVAHSSLSFARMKFRT
jgi:acyl-CoA synthetase (AMP-forming)/AMP-acid ligase II